MQECDKYMGARPSPLIYRACLAGATQGAEISCRKACLGASLDEIKRDPETDASSLPISMAAQLSLLGDLIPGKFQVPSKLSNE